MPSRESGQNNRQHNARGRERQDDAEALPEHRPRNHDAAIVDEDVPEQRDTLPRHRKRGEHREIPEQNLEQQRQIADHLDIAAAEPRNDPVVRKPADTHEKAEHGRKHDADRRHEQRIQEADEKRSGISVRFAEGDQRLADGKTGLDPEKIETGYEPLGRDILARRPEDVPGRERNQRQKQKLDHGRAHARPKDPACL